MRQAARKSQLPVDGTFSGTWQSRRAYIYREKKHESWHSGILLCSLYSWSARPAAMCEWTSPASGDNVKIATPFGGISVNKDQTSAAEIGLPAYPGIRGGHCGRREQVGQSRHGIRLFKLRVKVANYSTADNRDQVLAFYRNALSEYGNVIECAGGKPVGTPAATGEGLDCDHSDHDHSAAPTRNPDDLELKAGSPAISTLSCSTAAVPATHFSLIALDLPHGFESEQKGTN